MLGKRLMERPPRPGRTSLEGSGPASAVKPFKEIILKKFVHNQYGLWQDGCCRKWESEQEQGAYLSCLLGAGLSRTESSPPWCVPVSPGPLLTPIPLLLCVSLDQSPEPSDATSTEQCECVFACACPCVSVCLHTHHCLGNPHIWLTRD